jgi:hypothetical protein
MPFRPSFRWPPFCSQCLAVSVSLLFNSLPRCLNELCEKAALRKASRRTPRPAAYSDGHTRNHRLPNECAERRSRKRPDPKPSSPFRGLRSLAPFCPQFLDGICSSSVLSVSCSILFRSSFSRERGGGDAARTRSRDDRATHGPPRRETRPAGSFAKITWPCRPTKRHGSTYLPAATERLSHLRRGKFCHRPDARGAC